MGEVERSTTSLMEVELYCVNDGTSPAWITEKSARLVIVKQGELPPKPILTPSDIIQSEIEPMGPRRDSTFKWDAIGEGRHSPTTAATLIYGVVKYRDIFDKQRETWFCYQLTGYKTQRKMARIPGSPEYNKST